MSTTIQRKDLNRDQEEFIVNLLTIKATERFNPNNKKFTREQEAFPFFVVDKNIVRVPYAFGITLLNKFPHEDKDYHRINLTFQGQLRARQKKRVLKLDANFEKFRTSTLCAHTGFGKTRMSNYYIAQHNLLTVIMVPGTILMNQWPEAILEVLPDAKVGVVGEDYREELLDMESSTFWQDHPDILVCMPDRWQKIPIEVREKVGFLIVDEAHMFCTPTRCIPLLQFQPKYIMALTASPRRTEGTFSVIHALCGLHKVRARYPNEVTVWKFMSGFEFTTKKNIRQGTDWANTLKSIVTDEARNEMLADLASYLVEIGRKPIFMCERKYHVTDLVPKIRSRGVSCDFLMEDKDEYQDSQVLATIMKKAGTGFDEQYACPDFKDKETKKRIDTVVYCNSFREVNALIQYGGRGFRADDPWIIHIVDKNGIIESHWRAAQTYYRSGEYLKKVTIKTVKPDDIWEIEE